VVSYYTWDYSYGYAFPAINGVDVCYNPSVVVLGSCFPENEWVTVTFCDENYYWFEVETNECGAFYYYTSIPPWFGYGYTGPISVRAWVDAHVYGYEVDDGIMYANWPLYVYCGP